MLIYCNPALAGIITLIIVGVVIAVAVTVTILNRIDRRRGDRRVREYMERMVR